MARQVGKNRRCAVRVDGASRFHTGTAYFELDAAPALFDTAIRALAEGNSLRATGRIVQIDKDTACAWLHRAAVQCRVVKQRARGTVVAVTTRVVFGDAEAITARLHTSPTSTTVNTSFVERENFTLRQRNRRLTRKTSG